MNQPQLRSPTFAESVAIDNYKKALEGALASANSAGDKIATATVSAATAYGAVIALVAPKESASALVVALPFVGFAIALVLALWTQSLGIAAQPNDALDKIQSSVTKLVDRKRFWSRVALVTLGVGLVAAGLIVAEKYREPQETQTAQPAVVYLTPAGRDIVAMACGEQSTRLGGRVDPGELGNDWVRLEQPSPCPSVQGVLALPASAVSFVSVDD